MIDKNTKFKKSLMAIALPVALVMAGCASSNGLETAAHKEDASDVIDAPMASLSFSPDEVEPSVQENKTEVEIQPITPSEEVVVVLNDEVEVAKAPIPEPIEEINTSGEATLDTSAEVTDFAYLIENNDSKQEAMESVELDASKTESEVVAIAYPQHRVIKFKFDSKEVSAADMDKLTEHASYLRQTPKAILIVSGHADSQGNLLYNQSLSEQRAKQVADLLIYMGINPEQIKTQAFGDEQPTGVATAYKENRRVELSYEEPTLLSSRKK